MRLLRHDDPGFAAALKSLNRRATPAPHVAEAVAAIIAHVRATGDAALWAQGALSPSSQVRLGHEKRMS